MMRSRLLRPDDIKGAWAIVPTPATENASDWRSENTVDLDEAARVVNGLIDAGIDGILSMGTLGEAATLTHGEKLDYMRAKIGRASGRERVCQYVSISGVAGSLKQTNTL